MKQAWWLDAPSHKQKIMQYQSSPYMLPLIASAVVSALVVAYVWPRRQNPGGTPLTLIAIIITGWSVGYSLEIAGANLQTKLFWGKFQYIGIVFAPYLWLLFALAYTNQGRVWNGRFVNWLAALPTATLLLVFTTEFHGLVWAETFVEDAGTFSVLGVSYGPWFWVHFASSYLFMLAGTVITLRALRHMPGLYQAQIVAMLLGVLSPWVSNAIYFSGFSPVPGLDLTPFAFTITVVAFAWGIYGYRLGDIAPIARDLVVESMRDGMIVLDANGRIADINNAAGRMIGVPTSEAMGVHIAEVFSPWPHLVTQCQENEETSDQLLIGERESQRRYEVHISLLFDSQKRQIGRLINLHDLNTRFAPPPRFAAKETSRQSQIDPSTQPPPAIFSSNPLLHKIFAFIVVPVKTDIEVPSDVNPSWIQTVERAFTSILRVAAILATVALLFSLRDMSWLPNVVLTFTSIIGVLWFLGLARTPSFHLRANVFLLLLYALAFVEIFNFGYSVESFTFFLSFVIMAALLTDWKRGILGLILSLVTIGIFGWQIGAGNYLPPTKQWGDVLSPPTVSSALTSVVTFSACASAIFVAIIVLIRSLNRAWQLQTQAVNLLQQERDLLEQRVAERTADLARVRDQALEASHFKSELLAKVSHELRTPLGAILGYSELLHEETFGELTPRQKRTTGEIIESTHYLTALVEELLDEAQFQSSTLQLHMEPVATISLLQRTEAKMALLARRKGLEFSWVIDPQVPQTMYGDERRLQQILINLVGNAIKFTKTGQVQVRLYLVAPAEWAMEVKDTGPGIPVEAQSYIFDPFRQVDGSTTREHRGAGLGLSIVKQLTSIMGGRISLHSTMGQGSIFTVFLPLLHPENTIEA